MFFSSYSPRLLIYFITLYINIQYRYSATKKVNIWFFLRIYIINSVNFNILNFNYILYFSFINLIFSLYPYKKNKYFAKCKVFILCLVAGGRLELPTFGLWAQRAANCSTPRCLINCFTFIIICNNFYFIHIFTIKIFV